MNSILFVDDDINILSSFKRNLRGVFQITTAQGGSEALKIIDKNGGFPVIVSDMRMPVMNGAQFLAHAREKTPDSVRILLTGHSDINDAIAAINEGKIFRFLTKPCPNDLLVNTLQDALHQHRLITAEKELVEKTLQGSIKLLTDILAIVTPEAFIRSVRVRSIAVNIASRINSKKIWQVDVAAMLSQIGCVTLPMDIIKKKFAGKPLPKEDHNQFQKHMAIGRELLENIPRLEDIAAGIGYQEKCFNGEGPPYDKRSGKQIPEIGRILKVVLDYDTLTSAGANPLKAITVMRKNSDWYDPEVFAALEAEVLKAEAGFIIEYIPSNDIEIGMVLAGDVKTRSGILLVPKGHEISRVLIIRIRNFAEGGNIQEPLKVLKWVNEET